MSEPSPKTLDGLADLDAVIDSSRMGGFQIRVIALCAIMVMIDGFDTQVIGMVAPAIAAAWKVPPTAFGAVFGLGLFGGLIGAVTLGSAGDRLGRKPVLIASILLFSGVSLLTPLTHSIAALIAVRAVAGFGLGAALPGLIALTSEYAPAAARATVTALMYCGFPLGSVLAGIVSAQLIPRFGWTSVFYVGSLVPLALLPAFAIWVSESVRFLALRGDHVRVAQILRSMNVNSRWNGGIVQLAPARDSSVKRLFTEGRATGTVLLWTALFLSLLLTVFMVSWLPLVAQAGGMGMRSSVLAVSAWNIGGIAGCYAIGRLRVRFGLVRPIATAYAIGAFGIVLMGFAGRSGFELMLAALLAGVFTVGAQMCVIGLSASFYDTSVRATGVGWALGSGRVGAVVGPVIGGVLIGVGLPTPALFCIAGVISFATALVVLAMNGALARLIPAKAYSRPPPAGRETNDCADPTGRTRANTPGSA